MRIRQLGDGVSVIEMSDEERRRVYRIDPALVEAVRTGKGVTHMLRKSVLGASFAESDTDLDCEPRRKSRTRNRG